MFHAIMKRMNFLWAFDGELCKCLLVPFGIYCSLTQMLLFLFVCFFGLDDSSIDESGFLKSYTITVLVIISPFRSNNVCFIKLDAPELEAHTFIVVL